MRAKNYKLINAAFRFKIEPNKEYDQILQMHDGKIRDASISKWNITEVNANSLKFKLSFKDVGAISQGGVNFQDQLAVYIAELELLKFEKKTVSIRN